MFSLVSSLESSSLPVVQPATTVVTTAVKSLVLPTARNYQGTVWAFLFVLVLGKAPLHLPRTPPATSLLPLSFGPNAQGNVAPKADTEMVWARHFPQLDTTARFCKRGYRWCTSLRGPVQVFTAPTGSPELKQASLAVTRQCNIVKEHTCADFKPDTF